MYHITLKCTACSGIKCTQSNSANMVAAAPLEWSQTVWQCSFVVVRISGNDRHQSNHPRDLTRNITKRDGTILSFMQSYKKATAILYVQKSYDTYDWDA